MASTISSHKGKTVCELLCEIVRRNRRIAAIELCVYSQGKLPAVPKAVKALAQGLRHSLRQHGFWQSVLTICWRDHAAGNPLLKTIKHAAKHAATTKSRTFNVPRKEVNRATLKKIVDSLKPGEELAVTSKVRLTTGRWAHLPMVDFACYDTDVDLKKVLIAVRALGHKSGAIVRSGRSFHFYGFQPMSEDEWLTSMARFLLLAPIVDVRYAAHRIIDRVCTLRLSRRGESGTEPVVAARL